MIWFVCINDKNVSIILPIVSVEKALKENKMIQQFSQILSQMSLNNNIERMNIFG